MSKDTSLAAVISRWFAWAGGALILVSSILISFDVIARNLLSSTFFESFELSTYAMAASVSFGFAFALTTKAHIRIEVIYILFPPALRRLLDLLAILSLTAVAAAMAWFGAQTLLESWQLGARSNSALAVPLFIPQGIWAAGLVWFSIAAAWLAVRTVANLAARRGDRIEEEVGIASLSEEIEASTEAHQRPDASSLVAGH